MFMRRGWVVEEEIGGENGGDGLLRRRWRKYKV